MVIRRGHWFGEVVVVLVELGLVEQRYQAVLERPLADGLGTSSRQGCSRAGSIRAQLVASVRDG